MIEKFAVSEMASPGESLVNNLRAAVDAGCGGIGILERNLGVGEENELLWEFILSGLVATVALPAVPSVLPIPHLSGPEDIEKRVESICLAIRRLAPFAPVAVACLTGPVGTFGETKAREHVIQGLQKIARVGENVTPAGVAIGLEPVHASLREEWCFLTSVSEAVDLIDEVDEANVGVVLDTWHLGDSNDLLEEIGRHADRIVCVQIADRMNIAAGMGDRVLPGDGALDLVSILRTLKEVGYRGWYELEVWPPQESGEDLHQSPRGSSVDFAHLGRERFLELSQAAAAVAPSSA